MKSRLRMFAIAALTLFLVPILGAQDAAKPVFMAKKAVAVNSAVTVSDAVEALPASASPAPDPAAPAPPPQPNGSYSSTPKVELFLGYSLLRSVPDTAGNRLGFLNGGSTSLAFNFSRHLGLVADFGGLHADRFGPNAPPNGGVVSASGNVFTYMLGPRISFRHKITPFAQALFGGVHASDVVLSGCSGIGCTPLPAENSFAMTAGGGLDVPLSRHFALRVFQLEYLMTRFADRSTAAGNTATQNDMRFSTGLVYRFGGNPPPPPAPRANRAPVATCSGDRAMVYAQSGDAVMIHVQASDADNDPLTYTWTATGGAVVGVGPDVRWNSSGAAPGTYTARVRVDDGRGGTADCSVEARVELRPNRPPTISCSGDRNSVVIGESVQITAIANDPDNDPLTFTWSASGGRIAGSGSSARFDTSGLAPGRYTVTGRVDDGRGGTADCSLALNAQAPPAPAIVTELETRLALHSIYFPTAQPTLRNPNGPWVASQQMVVAALADDFKKYLGFKPDAHLILEGHADPRGSVDYNNALTERRVASTKSLLVGQGIPAASIETRSLGKQEDLSADQVKQLIGQNPNLTPEDRRRLLGNIQVITLANNRRVDVTLSTTGQQSTRLYPFNAKDALTLIDTQRTGAAKRPAPAKPKQP